MLLWVKYRFGTPAWFLNSWANQELQPWSQRHVVIYTGPLEAWWLEGEKTATTKKLWMQELNDNKHRKAWSFPFTSGKTKKKRKKRGKKKAQATPLTSADTLPPTQKWEKKQASISANAFYQGSHTDVSIAIAALETQKAALDSKQLSTETVNHAGFRLNISLSKVPCCIFSA